MIALLFPGQGAQRAGMLHALRDLPEAGATIDTATRILERDVRTIDADPQAYRRSTADAQCALFVAGVACANALAAAGVRAGAAAGHSVGAFAAAVACGALDFEAALRLVDLRGRTMAKRFPAAYGMGAIGGLDRRAVEALVAAVHTPAAPVYAANVNAPDQIAVAGANVAVDAVLALARERGARTARRLEVVVPAHTPLMAETAATLEAALQSVRMQTPRIAYATNATARVVRDAEGIRTDLSASVALPVQWSNATRALYERGARLFVEARPGTTLTDLAAYAFADARAIAMEAASTASIAALAARL
ncbi:MAG: malonate decarboxylase subunit epsilon [Candidatus Velthaea sp.]